MACSPSCATTRSPGSSAAPAVRCLQTVEPLARRRGVPIETTDALGVDADPDGLVALLLDPAATEAVLCSHGELIGKVVERLVGQLPDAELELIWPKGSTWVLEVADGQLRSARYLPPLRVQDAQAGYY
jgi:8-oxo-(d)GTP phosphatase